MPHPKNSSELPEEPTPSPALFRPAATTFFRVIVVGCAAGLGSLAYGVYQYYHSPYWNRLGLAPDQPVLFSHRHHAGELRIDCRFCHTTVETSAFAGMPTTQTCLTCHAQLFTDTTMLQPVIHSATTGEPLPWTRVTHLPDHVYFDHSIHLAKGVSCTTCHGDLGKMALTAKAQPLDMRWCLDCHRDPQPRLQPRSQLFAAGGTKPDMKQMTAGPVSMASVADHAAHLTNCSTCHH